MDTALVETVNEAPIKFHWKRKILHRVEKELEMSETSASLNSSREEISETGWSCRICKRGDFSRRFTRDRHELTHRSTETHFDCPMCNRKLKRADYLLKHIARHHSGTKEYKCPFCEKTLRSEKTITNHEMRNHADRFFLN